MRYLRTIFVPEDETCFHLFEAVSADAVAEASKRAAIEHERIVEAQSIPRSDRQTKFPCTTRRESEPLEP